MRGMKSPLIVSPSRTAAVLALACLTLAPLAHAGGKPKREPFKPPYDKIDAVDASAKTITISHVNSKDHTNKTLTITPLTEIQVNGADAPKGDISKLHSGMRVDASMGMDATTASRVVASDSK